MSMIVRLESVRKDWAKISLEGDLIVRDAAIIKSELITILHTYTNADLYLQHINRIDVAGFQLLSALKKSADATGKHFQIFFESPGSLQDTITISGFTHLFTNSIS
jgi:ABC-type transporter Mla MlaB component